MGDNRYSAEPVTGYPVASNSHVALNGHHPQPPGNAYYYPNTQGSYYYNPNRFSPALRLLLIFLIVSFSIIFLMFIIALAVIRPRYPQFRVSSLSMTNFNISSSDFVSGNWAAGFQVYNPNSKLRVYYDNIYSAVFFNGGELSHISLRPFYQETKNSTTLDAQFSSLNVYFDKGSTLADTQNRGFIPFDLKLEADVRFRTRGFTPRKSRLRVVCRNVQVFLSGGRASGNFSGPARPCQVYLSRRIFSY